jgi:hypothetical protein
MGHQNTVFEREALYAEIWAEPVRTVAARYGLSDTGLRKICIRLGVPLPPLGYWARLAAGKKPRVIALPATHKGIARYVRSVYIDEDAGERMAAFLDGHAPTSTAIVVKPTVDACHPIIQRMAKRMRPRSRDLRRLLFADGSDVFEAALSEAHKDRGLRILDAALTAILAAGGSLRKPGADDKRLKMDLFGEIVGLRIAEQIQRLARELTQFEKMKQAKEAYFYIPDPWTYQPTGKLTLTLLSDNDYHPFASLSDAKTSPLEARLDGIIERLWSKVAERKVKREMQEEDTRRRQAEWARHEALVAIRDNELEELKETETLADRWRRPNALRSYAAAFEESRAKAASHGKIVPKDVTRIAWIRNAAAWLDPLTAAHWPAVDIGVEEDDEAPNDEIDGDARQQ